MENKKDLYNQEVEQYVIYYATKEIEQKDFHYLRVMFDHDHSPLDKKRVAVLNDKETVEFSVIGNIIKNIEDSEQALSLFEDVFPAIK